jgi:hypothetical protein
MGDVQCVVCRRRTPIRGQVCDPDRRRIAEQLDDLPRKLTALTLQLVPGAGAFGERVHTSRTGSPVGARLDALTLVAAGNDSLSVQAVAGMLHPHIRKWCTRHTVQVDGQDREIVTWHQELVRDADGNPVNAIADDQVGILPPAEWLDSWVRAWRRHFGHAQRPHDLLDAHARGWSKAPKTPEQLGELSRSLAARRHAAQVLLGLTRGYNGAPVLRTDDPIAEEWEIRFGEPAAPDRPAADIRYLRTWLDRACDDDAAIADFAAELRALDAELTRVLGERPDQQWLGRCPTSLTERESGTSKPCGAGLWQDPYTSQVVCPRCRSTWGPGGPALLRLAAEIRRVWPVDRRRRYTTAEVAALRAERPLACPTCASVAFVAWREVTAAGEREQMWRPERARCPMGCPDAERLI